MTKRDPISLLPDDRIPTGSVPGIVGSESRRPPADDQGCSEGTEVCYPTITDAPLDEGDAVELARILSALADPVRLRLISLVVSQEELCSCDLERPLGRSQPTISHHTRVLVEAGLLVGERRGRWMWWRIAPGSLAAVRAALGG